MRRVSLLTVALLAGTALLAAPPPAPWPPPLSVSLKTLTSTIVAGQVPAFQVTVKNLSQQPVKIVSPNAGLGLQWSSYELFVFHGGVRVELGIAISDPPEPMDNDFVFLQPGAAVSGTLREFQRALHELPPGTYEARVVVSRYPHAAGGITSPPARFKVTRPGRT